MRCSIRTRLTLLYGVVMPLGLTMFSVGVFWLHARRGRPVAGRRRKARRGSIPRGIGGIGWHP